MKKQCRNVGHRWVAMVLSACIVCTLLPSAALAADNTFQSNITVGGTNISCTFQILDEDAHTVQIGDGTNSAIDVASAGAITIPAKVTNANSQEFTVTAIGVNAFRLCPKLTGSLAIPESVKTIENETFVNMRNAAGTLTIPEGVTSIGVGAFSNCENLTGGLAIPNSVTSIGAGAFLVCSFTGTLTIPNTLETIKESTFQACKFTGALTIPPAVKTIENGAFIGLKIESVTISESDITLNAMAFSESTTLAIMKLRATPPTIDITDTSEWTPPFAGCADDRSLILLDENGVELTESALATAVKAYMDVNDGDTTDKKWYGWKLPPLPPEAGDTFSVSIKDGNDADVSCTVKVLTTPSGSTPGTVQIGDGSTSAIDVTSAGEITIPAKVTNENSQEFTVTAIGDAAFSGCGRLTSVTLEPAVAPTLGAGAFANTNQSLQIQIPQDASGYDNTVWDTFTIVDLNGDTLKPVFTHNLSTAEVSCHENATATALNATAKAIGKGQISYEWYSNSTNSTTDGGVLIADATAETYTPPTTSVGTTYYYCVATNTNNGAAGNKTATETTNVAQITIKRSDTGSGGGTTPTPQPGSPTQAEVKVVAQVDDKGNVTANITDNSIIEAIKTAETAAKKKGTEANGITLVLNVNTDNKTGNQIAVNLPKTVQDIIVRKKIVSTVVALDSPDVQIAMDLSAIKEINVQAQSDVNLTTTLMDSNELTGNAKTAIGNRPAFAFKATYGSGKQVQNLGAGSVTVSIPYTFSANEKADHVQAVYVDEGGNVQWLTDSVYNSTAKVLRFGTNHFAFYGVGYAESTAFRDITNHWAKNDIDFVVKRGIFAGTTAVTYAPDQPIKRQEIAVIMHNYAKAMGYTLNKTVEMLPFADSAKSASWAAEAVEAMQQAGVVIGKSGNCFDPIGVATRAEASTILRRYVELVIDA